jgi:hypothetical protein
MDLDLQEQRALEVKYRVAAQPRLDEPVLAAGLFRRPGGLNGLVSRLRGRDPSPGLPETFLLAITPMKMHAFAASLAGGELHVNGEVAVWDRATSQVTAAPAAGQTLVTIERPGVREKVVCSTGKDDLSRSVVRYMLDPAVVAA